MNFVCIVFEFGNKMLTLSSMENVLVACKRSFLQVTRTNIKSQMS